MLAISLMLVGGVIFAAGVYLSLPAFSQKTEASAQPAPAATVAQSTEPKAILDLRYQGPGGKIVPGGGSLEIDHLTIIDGSPQQSDTPLIGVSPTGKVDELKFHHNNLTGMPLLNNQGTIQKLDVEKNTFDK